MQMQYVLFSKCVNNVKFSQGWFSEIEDFFGSLDNDLGFDPFKYVTVLLHVVDLLFLSILSTKLL